MENEKEDYGDITLYIIPHSHVDLSWGGGYQLCSMSTIDAMLSLIDSLESSPDYKFTIENILAFKTFTETAAESLVKKLLIALKDGRVDISGLYHGTEENLPGPENLARQFLLGKGWLKRRWGIDTEIAWSLDTPGHTLQMPQLLRKSGIRFFVISCGICGPRFFRWASPDESEILVYTMGGYTWSFHLGLRNNVKAMEERVPVWLDRLKDLFNTRAVLLDDGADWSRSSSATLRNINEWNGKGNRPKMRMATTTEFYRVIRAEIEKAPLLRGEAPTSWAYTPAQYPRVIRWNRKAEYSLRAAEAMETIRMSLYGDNEYPSSKLNQSWEWICKSVEHNWGGVDGEIVGREREHMCKAAYYIGKDILRSAIEHIATLIKNKSRGLPIHVFNPTGFMNDGYVEDIIHLEMLKDKGEGGLLLTDLNDRPVQFDIIEELENEDGTLRGFRIGFVAEDVPPYGYKTYYLKSGRSGDNRIPNLTSETEKSIENEYYRVTIEDGRVAEIFDKAEKRNLIKDDFLELTCLEDRSIDLIDNIKGILGREDEERTVKIERNKVRSKVTIESRILSSLVRKEITLYAGLKLVDIKIILDWDGPKYSQLRVNLPFRFEGEYWYEVPYGRVKFPDKIEYWAPYGAYRYDERETGKRRWPNLESLENLREVQNWILMSEADYEILLCTDSSTFSFQKDLQHVLLRTVYSCGDPGLFYNRRGTYEWSYRIISGRRVSPEAEGIRFLTPLETATFWRRDLCRARGELPELPEEQSFLNIDNENVIVTALKKAEDDRGWILRFYNASDHEQTAKITLNLRFKQAYETNLIEEPISELRINKSQVNVRLSGWEIKTLKLF